jgi:universal stress protein A
MDFDHNSVAALRIARRLSQENLAKLYVIQVVPPVAPLAISAPAIAHRSEEQSRTHLAEIERDELAAVDHETALRFGHPAEEVIAAAAEFKTEVIVMATHGRTGVSHLLLGSVAEKVVREAPCLVITSTQMRCASKSRQPRPRK